MSGIVLSLYPNELPIDKPVLVPDDVYTAYLVQHTTWKFKGKHEKIVLTFSIQDYGEHNQIRLNAYYNAKSLKGKPKKGGHFSAGWKSKFMFDYATCFGTPPRNDRISMCKFRNVLVKVKTRTVTHNRDQRKIPEGLKYSVIDHLVEVIRT